MVACLPPSSPGARSPSPHRGQNNNNDGRSHHKMHTGHRPSQAHESDNRILRTLMSKLGTCSTFGENLIFMINRAGGCLRELSCVVAERLLIDRTDEDLCMQLLVLKLLYLLFTTKGTSEYFYMNDLCVLVDVFLREIVNIDEDNESVRLLLLACAMLYSPLHFAHICFSSATLISASYTHSSPRRKCATPHTNARRLCASSSRSSRTSGSET